MLVVILNLNLHESLSPLHLPHLQRVEDGTGLWLETKWGEGRGGLGEWMEIEVGVRGEGEGGEVINDEEDNGIDLCRHF